jgi:UDP-glucose 4-epimerase
MSGSISKILITGSAGFIGSNAKPFFEGKGFQVSGMDTLNDSDILDSLCLNEKMKGVDYVLHLAGISSLPDCQAKPKECYNINTSGTAAVLEAARLKGVKRVVFASTGALYENNTIFPCHESHVVTPHLHYTLSKKFAEDICHTYRKCYGMDITILRYFNVYGPQQNYKRKHPPLIGYIINCLSKDVVPDLYSAGLQSRDYIYIDDVNEMNLLALTHPNAQNKTYNVCSETQVSVKFIYNFIAKYMNKDHIVPNWNDPTMLWDKYPELYQGKGLHRELVKEEVNKETLGEAKDAFNDLGWTSRISIEEGLERTIKAYLKNI